MIGRLWYPQLDVYDAIRRIAGLLSLSNPDIVMSPERLYIADFYLANPPLLHKTHMSRDVRIEFNALEIGRPEKSFVSYPSAPLLFQKMSEVQKQAFRTLTAKGLIDLEALGKGVVRASRNGDALLRQRFLPLFSAGERRLASFIVNSFVTADKDILAIRRNTGLRRITACRRYELISQPPNKSCKSMSWSKLTWTGFWIISRICWKKCRERRRPPKSSAISISLIARRA
jgi:hypothetical protein